MDPFQARLSQRAMRNPYKHDEDALPVRIKTAVGAFTFVVFLFFVLTPSAPSGGEPGRALRQVALPPTPLAIMTFNLRFAGANDGYNSWDYRKQHVYDLVDRYHPVIMGTQEGLKDQLAELHANLAGNYERFGVEREPNGEFEQIFYDADVLERVDGDNYWLSDTPEVPHETAWGAPCVRMVTWCRFRLKATRQEFIFINTQFDHRSEESRIKSAALIWDRIQSFDASLPVFVVGDFNTYRHTSVYSYLTSEDGANLAEAWQTADHTIGDVSYTYHGWAGVDNDGEKVADVVRAENHIDWILYRPRNLKVLTTEVITESRDGRYPSDHYPIQASLLLPNVDVLPAPRLH
ncbi:hypothetical protein SDRG_00223 [Saprolegnia diclina VS20]|uniref:Endonuclease/exonuclease/phosphatase domain-containing protein n=1 Tax=Saprolegnia diclina (strain VS20) TaxID=1156394 RepID=T0R7R4_SAPDV|nr:hypothetical protein SDRG_00223 [Saprolegnia diclina VS20]EQC42490.1 hypothetical protein SDRG_00223 [Saprolegnia diclina VS20]|eukprot:XP_008603913.1 hypothetical protein SDRG_00223 [Saprolegnia diclina VS20]